MNSKSKHQFNNIFLNSNQTSMEKMLKFVLLLLFARSSFCQNIAGCLPVLENDNGLYTLRFLNCDSDDIKMMAENITKAWDVVVIDISNSKLESIDEFDLQQNKLLKKFVAFDNKLNKFPTECFSKAPAIEEVNLSANQIKEISADTFKGVDTLTTINLSDNQIYCINDDAFVKLNHLKTVDLSKNQLYTLEEINFCAACVVSLHLEGNPIKRLEPQHFPMKINTSVMVRGRRLKRFI